MIVPQLWTALLAGALLSFARSFDEVVVTNFTSGVEQMPAGEGVAAAAAEP